MYRNEKLSVKETVLQSVMLAANTFTTNKQLLHTFIHLYMQFLSFFVNPKAHANGRNIVGQEHATLLGPTCCVRLHRTTTMLALVAYCLKPVNFLGLNGRNIVGQQRAAML